jgi:hypothetical protein
VSAEGSDAGGFDGTSLPDDVILTNSFTVRDGRIVTLIIIATEPATTPQRRQA